MIGFSFPYHCDISKRLKNGTKDLSIIWDTYKIPGYTEDNTVIIDDYDEVYKIQPYNCIISPPFEFTNDNSDKDDYLKRLEPELIKMKKSINSRKHHPAESVNISLKLIPQKS